jgi:uracil-DNA glycosylase
MTLTESENAGVEKQALQGKRLRAFAELGLGLALRPRGEFMVEPEPLLELEALVAQQARPLTAPQVPVQSLKKPLTTEQDEPHASAIPSFGTLQALQQQVAECVACGLCKGRTQTVFAAGNPLASLAIVGEAPGAEEDRTGQAFVGQAGKLLDGMLASLGLNRAQDAYICNVLKCRPPNNRDPSPDEVAKCEPFLQNQLNLVQPKMILVVGRFAAQSLLRTESSIASLRGKLHSYSVGGRDVPVVVTYHPAYLLRNLADKSKTWADLCFLKSQMSLINDA